MFPLPVHGERVAVEPAPYSIRGRVRGALRDASWLPAPHPALRATFSPRSGEKRNCMAACPSSGAARHLLPAQRGEEKLRGCLPLIRRCAPPSSGPRAQRSGAHRRARQCLASAPLRPRRRGEGTHVFARPSRAALGRSSACEAMPRKRAYSFRPSGEGIHRGTLHGTRQVRRSQWLEQGEALH